MQRRVVNLASRDISLLRPQEGSKLQNVCKQETEHWSDTSGEMLLPLQYCSNSCLFVALTCIALLALPDGPLWLYNTLQTHTAA